MPPRIRRCGAGRPRLARAYGARCRPSYGGSRAHQQQAAGGGCDDGPVQRTAASRGEARRCGPRHGAPRWLTSWIAHPPPPPARQPVANLGADQPRASVNWCRRDGNFTCARFFGRSSSVSVRRTGSPEADPPVVIGPSRPYTRPRGRSRCPRSGGRGRRPASSRPPRPPCGSARGGAAGASPVSDRRRSACHGAVPCTRQSPSPASQASGRMFTGTRRERTAARLRGSYSQTAGASSRMIW